MTKEVTYKVVFLQTKALVQMNDPLFCSPWYLKTVRNGTYTWTRNELFAKELTFKTATKHKKDLEAGADKDWENYRNLWK